MNANIRGQRLAERSARAGSAHCCPSFLGDGRRRFAKGTIKLALILPGRHRRLSSPRAVFYLPVTAMPTRPAISGCSAGQARRVGSVVG